MSAQADESMIWVKTEPAVDGSGYVVTLEVDQDTARVLTSSAALAYAAEVLAAVSRAEYDAAVMRQMTQKLELPLETAAQVVFDMRADRPPLSSYATMPLVLEPAANLEFKPFIKVSSGAEFWQWDMEAARDHALGVLEATAVADLDTTYLRTLVNTIGLDKPTAEKVVGDLANHRDKP